MKRQRLVPPDIRNRRILCGRQRDVAVLPMSPKRAQTAANAAIADHKLLWPTLIAKRNRPTMALARQILLLFRQCKYLSPSAAPYCLLDGQRIRS